MMLQRQATGQTAYAIGLAAEDAVCSVLAEDGWCILARRLRTAAIIEGKSRPTLAEAAICLTRRQRSRLLGACEIITATHPEWGRNGVRFDVLLVDPQGRVRRIADAFRLGDP